MIEFGVIDFAHEQSRGPEISIGMRACSAYGIERGVTTSMGHRRFHYFSFKPNPEMTTRS